MDIPSAAAISNFQQGVTQQAISMRVAVKANDIAKAQGEMVLNLLGAAVDSAGDSGTASHRIDLVA
jgi:hypothetical protein